MGRRTPNAHFPCQPGGAPGPRPDRARSPPGSGNTMPVTAFYAADGSLLAVDVGARSSALKTRSARRRGPPRRGAKGEGAPPRPARPASVPARGNCDGNPAPRAQRIPARTMAAVLACALSATACAAGTAPDHQPRATAHQANPTGVTLPQIPASRRERGPPPPPRTTLSPPPTSTPPTPHDHPAHISPRG